MKMYSIFCTNQDTSSAVIEKEMKKTTFRNFVQEAYKSPALHKLQLRDFMIKPIQRVCKYPLLLRVYEFDFNKIRQLVGITEDNNST